MLPNFAVETPAIKPQLHTVLKGGLHRQHSQLLPLISDVLLAISTQQQTYQPQFPSGMVSKSAKHLVCVDLKRRGQRLGARSTRDAKALPQPTVGSLRLQWWSQPLQRQKGVTDSSGRGRARPVLGSHTPLSVRFQGHRVGYYHPQKRSPTPVASPTEDIRAFMLFHLVCLHVNPRDFSPLLLGCTNPSLCIVAIEGRRGSDEGCCYTKFLLTTVAARVSTRLNTSPIPQGSRRD